jgi:hypothetical protein
MRRVCMFMHPSFPTARQHTLAREKMHYPLPTPSPLRPTLSTRLWVQSAHLSTSVTVIVPGAGCTFIATDDWVRRFRFDAFQ